MRRYASMLVYATLFSFVNYGHAAVDVLETMTDRCSEDVIVSAEYNEEFPPKVGIGMLIRDANGYTPWSDKMPVNGREWIRWWCHSTKGNWADPGTWRLKEGSIGTGCVGDWDQGSLESCKPAGSLSLGSSEREGWTPERSRCASNETKAISARLGPDRLLEIRCHRYLNKEYEIKTAHSNLCLDIEYGDATPQRKLQQYTCHGGANQRFRLISAGNAYEIRPFSSDLCLDVEFGDNQDHRLVQQFPCHQTSNQRFKLEIAKTGEIKVVSSNKCLDIPNDSPNTGVKIQQFSCNKGLNQRFSVQAAP